MSNTTVRFLIRIICVTRNLKETNNERCSDLPDNRSSIICWDYKSNCITTNQIKSWALVTGKQLYFGKKKHLLAFKFNWHITLRLESNPGHIGERRVLWKLRQPCSCHNRYTARSLWLRAGEIHAPREDKCSASSEPRVAREFRAHF